MIDPNSPLANLVMVFSRPGCGPCTGTKRMLQKLGVEYVEIDLATNEEAAPVLKAAGAAEAPVVTYGGRIWTTGFNPDRLEKLAEVILHPWPEEAAA